MIVAIPSKGRPNKVKSQKVITTANVYVPENEAEAYQSCGVQNVIPVPTSVKGITKTRNWILDNADDEWVVMVDDDVNIVGWKLLGEHNVHDKSFDGEITILQEFVRLFEITVGMNYRIWGCSTEAAPRSIYPFFPFRFHSYVTASCIGIINKGIRFDESFPVKEDYELCLRCIKEDGGVVAARYFYWQNSHWSDEGGCKDYRNGKMEEDCIKRLMKMYPGFISKVARNKSEYTIRLDF